jgi:MFS family permease
MPPSVRLSFFGWRVVAGAFLLAVFGWGLGFYGPPVYLHAVQEQRGWPLLQISAAVTTHFLFGAIVVANLPKLYRRFGIAAITKVGALSLALGVIGWSEAQQPWQLFAATLLSGTGWAATGAAAINEIVAPWFVRSRPAALAAAYNGASIGGVVFSPLWVVIVGFWGFPLAAGVVGIAAFITVWLLSDLLFAKTPHEMGLAPDGDVNGTATTRLSSAQSPPSMKIWSDIGFLTLSEGMTLSLFSQVGLVAHLFSLLVPALGDQLAGITMGAATAAAIAGRTLVGWLMPVNADRRLIACANYAVQIAGSLALLVAGGSNVPLLLTGVLLFGIGIGNTTSLPPLIAQTEFDQASVSRVVALIVAISQGSYAFAPAAFGILRELSDRTVGASTGYAPYLFAGAALIQAAAIVALLSGRRKVRDSRAMPG